MPSKQSGEEAVLAIEKIKRSITDKNSVLSGQKIKISCLTKRASLMNIKIAAF